MTGISQTVNEAAGFQIPFSDNETTLYPILNEGVEVRLNAIKVTIVKAKLTTGGHRTYIHTALLDRPIS